MYPNLIYRYYQHICLQMRKSTRHRQLMKNLVGVLSSTTTIKLVTILKVMVIITRLPKWVIMMMTCQEQKKVCKISSCDISHKRYTSTPKVMRMFSNKFISCRARAVLRMGWISRNQRSQRHNLFRKREVRYE